MGGKKSKQQGTAFEYRIKDWFNQRPGWKAERNPLSGASEQIKETVSKHDVRAWNETGIFLQIEAKKRTRVADPKKRHQIEIKREWIDKIDFAKDEMLVIGFDRSDLFAFVPTPRFLKLLKRELEIEYTDDNTFKGSKQFIFKEESLAGEYYHIKWKCEAFEEDYTLLKLDKFITLRETIDLSNEVTLSFEDKVMRATKFDVLDELEKTEGLTHRQKRLLYQKYEEMESGHLINPMARANTQFWLDDAFICICPHCAKEIRKDDFGKKGTEVPS